jgi:LmbE family N-acetylglucosaminyl deacetylase
MKAARVLLVIPHPDDEVVGCAAAIARARAQGTAFLGLYLTTGVPAREAFWPWQRRSHGRRVAERRREAQAAASALGIEPVAFADRPSRRLKSYLPEAKAELEAAIARTSADALWVSAWEGGHQDHDVANFLAARFRDRMPVAEFAEYNFAGGRVRSQRFPQETGEETVLKLTPEEAATKRGLLALYCSEQDNLAHVGTEKESLRPLPAHDYAAPPHPGRLFRERFHWVPFPHPRIDFEPSERVRAALR